MSKIVHVVGTGTIGEPLIGLLADEKEAFGLDEVTFHKRTPLIEERAKVNDLLRRGAALAVDNDHRAAFEDLGHKPKYEAREAIERATVVIDCTPAGNANKDEYYQRAQGPLGFLAQGSELGFGKMYARGINDHALVRGDDRFIHVVSCNTHNISVLVHSIALDGGVSHLESGRFLCMRRTNDISQEAGFTPSPRVGTHGDARFGTHHARDAHGLFATIGQDLPLWSSAVELNTQYMHAIWFSLSLDREITVAEARERFESNTRVAMTYKRTANVIFSFGRDHGYFGRILSQTVIPVETLAVRNGNELIGFCFTPQDGNALLSSVAAMLWYLCNRTVAADASGVYVAGNTFDTIPGGTSLGSEDAFIRKYDPDGNELWTRQFGTTNSDAALGISMDATGVYVGGRTGGALPGQTSNSLGQDDGFLRKYNSGGDELWTRQFGTTSGDRVHGVAADTSGVYVAGETGGPLASPPQGTDGFVRKYNADGMALWTKQITSENQNDIAYAVAVDASGVFVVGDTTGTFAGQTKVGGLYDGWTRKFDLDGNTLWTRQFGTTDDDNPRGASTGAGWLYIAEFTNDRTLLQRFDLDGGNPSVLQLSINRNFAYAVAANATAAYLAGSKDGDSLDQTPLGDLDALLLRIKHGESMITGVFDGANSLPVISPGGTFQAYFTAGTIPATMTSSTVPLSNDLGFSILVNGRPAPLFGVFAGEGFDQANGVVPWDTETGGQASLTFAMDGTPVKGSAPFAVDVAPATPGIYTFQYGLGPAIVQNFSDASFALAPGSLGATPAHPAPIGSVIIIWANGLGPISGIVPDGDAPAPGSPLLIPTPQQVRLFIGGVQATILATVLHPTLVSLFQMNAIVPPGVTPGNEVSIEIEVDFGGGNVFRSRDDVFIAVSP